MSSTTPAMSSSDLPVEIALDRATGARRAEAMSFSTCSAR